MDAAEAVINDTPLGRLTDFITKYPEVKFLRLVHFCYSGRQQCKSIPIHHAKLLAANARTLRPGDEVVPPEGLATGNGDARGVIPGTPTWYESILTMNDDMGDTDWDAAAEGENSTQIDWTTLSPILHHPSYGYAATSFYHFGARRSVGHGYASDPRIALAKVVRGAKEEADMEFKVGIEIEFTLFDRTDLSSPLQEAQTSMYGNQHSSRGITILETIVEALEYAGVHVWSFHPEGDVMGQYELQLFPQDPLTATDQVLFTQHIVREVAMKHGCLAAFNAMSHATAVNGRHINISLSRPEDDTHFLAGLLAHMPSLMAILHASIDGYMCRQGEAGPFALWAETKLGPINWKAPGRLEVRTPDCHFSVHLQIAAIIEAGLEGIKRRLTPKQADPIPFDDLRKYCFSKPDTVAKVELAKQYNLDIALPKDLGEAVERFKEEKNFWIERLGEKVVQGVLLTQEGKWKRRQGKSVEQRRVALIERFG